MPSDGDGEVLITLTETSAEILAKIPELKTWSVAPTMTRGSKGKGIKRAKLVKVQAKGGQSLVEKKKQDTVKKKDKAEKKEKKEKKKKITVNTDELTDADFRRTPQGRQNIENVMKELYSLDQKAFPTGPAFTPEGHCRMKFEGASKFTWDEMLKASGRAMESLWFGLFICLRSFLIFGFVWVHAFPSKAKIEDR